MLKKCFCFVLCGFFMVPIALAEPKEKADFQVNWVLPKDKQSDVPIDGHIYFIVAESEWKQMGDAWGLREVQTKASFPGTVTTQKIATQHLLVTFVPHQYFVPGVQYQLYGVPQVKEGYSFTAASTVGDYNKVKPELSVISEVLSDGNIKHTIKSEKHWENMDNTTLIITAVGKSDVLFAALGGHLQEEVVFYTSQANATTLADGTLETCLRFSIKAQTGKELGDQELCSRPSFSGCGCQQTRPTTEFGLFLLVFCLLGVGRLFRRG